MENKSMEDLIILHEDNHVIVVLKPQNIPSCEDESKDRDMLTIIKDYIKVKYDKPGNVYLGLVHRLDRPTGGVMVFAKSSKAAARLSEQIKDGDFEKRYFAVVVGTPKEEKATLTHYMKKNAINNMVYICPPTVSGAKFAELEYNVLETVSDLSMVDVRLHTGRSHQIRVQMSSIGTPVYGDMRYGGERLKRAILHFGRIIFHLRTPLVKKEWCSVFNHQRKICLGVCLIQKERLPLLNQVYKPTNSII